MEHTVLYLSKWRYGKGTDLREPSGEDLAVVLVALAIFRVVHGVFGHFVLTRSFKR